MSWAVEDRRPKSDSLVYWGMSLDPGKSCAFISVSHMGSQRSDLRKEMPGLPSGSPSAELRLDYPQFGAPQGSGGELVAPVRLPDLQSLRCRLSRPFLGVWGREAPREKSRFCQKSY